jgi:hypothetical protein
MERPFPVSWLYLSILSALLLGVYDLFKKLAVRVASQKRTPKGVAVEEEISPIASQMRTPWRKPWQ